MSKAGIAKLLGVPVEIEYDESLGDSMTLVTLSSPTRGEESVLVSKYGVKKVDSKNYVTAPKERIVPKKNRIRGVFRFVSYSLAWILASCTLTFIALDVTGIVKARIVLTGSMVPTINPGDIAIDVKPSIDPPAIGKIVTYTGRRLDGTAVALFSHRIIGGDLEQGFIVKGDANPSPDTQKPVLSDITGVVAFKIPYIGKLLNTRDIILGLLGIFGIWLIRDAFREEE